MNTFTLPSFARRTAIAAAVGLACVAAQAQSEPVEASISVGIAHVDGSGADKAIFGQYNGLRDVSTAGSLGLDYSLRDPDAGKWVDFLGTNLLGDTRELEFAWKNPGVWTFTAGYGELTRNEPLIVNSGLGGVGTTALSINKLLAAGSGADLDLSTKRTSLGLGFSRIISPQLQLSVDVKTEEKNGARLFGALVNNGSCVSVGSVVCLDILSALLLPEPINSYHSQLEARASYTLENLRVHATYYGSVYSNSNATLSPVSGAATGIVPNYLVALPPDNQAHQFDLSGSYDISKATRTTFKLAWATAQQNADFPTGLAGPLVSIANGSVLVTSPGARVDTTLAKFGFSSRVSTQLSLLGDIRYEDKDDKTNLFNYNLNSANFSSTNHHLPNQKLQGKLQASWQFNSHHRGTLGADYESIDRGTYTASSILAGVSAIRQKTHETGVRAELRSRVSDELGGAVTLSSSQRDGSSWLQAAIPGATGVTEVADSALTQAVLMPTMADRQRNKVRFSADWQPNKDFNLQVSAEESHDSYSSPSSLGLQDARVRQLGLDWSYNLSSAWALNGYVSQGTQTMNQSLAAGSVLALDNTNLATSIGLIGKLSSTVRMGANLGYLDDRTVYAQSAANTLPDVSYSETSIKVFATYQIEKNATVRLDVVHQKVSTDDWTWKNVTFSDGTTVRDNPRQSVNLIGVSYVYQWK
jgi:MtrB/PioB family decaheme-associated outer membrane protein